MDIHIPNQEILQDKINKIKKAGLSSLHLVADFDRTLTKAHNADGRVQSTYGLIREGKYLSDEYTKIAFAQYDKYRPFEISTSLSSEEKHIKMDKWWEEHWVLLKKEGFNLGIIHDLILKNKIMLRDGCQDFLDFLAEKDIPLLIISAGLGNLIKEFIRQSDHERDKVHIISNFFKFDEKGIAISYNKKFIHSLNKHEVEVIGTSYEKEITGRRNVILLGDSIGDIGMSKGLDHDTVLNIGFLNKDTKENLEEYSKHYDVIILNDGSMSYINKLLADLA